MNSYLKASNNPLDDINAVTYAGQSPQNRMYKQGYEDYFEMLPVLADDDPKLPMKIDLAKGVMNGLAHELKLDPWTPSLQPLVGGFNRTILGMEAPRMQSIGALKEGSEVVLARWGDGMTSPVHGHADGLLYEQLLFGTMRVNTYRITDHAARIVRPVEAKIYKDFINIAATYTATQQHVRSALVHNFTSIGYSASLHYVPEHTRDGRDNGFSVEYFDERFLYTSLKFKQLNAAQGIEQLKIGDVALVRSENVPGYGDHWIVITGAPIIKEHGLRPQEVSIHAPGMARVLNHYKPIMGLTLLKANEATKKAFHAFHGITIDNGNVIFQTA